MNVLTLFNKLIKQPDTDKKCTVLVFPPEVSKPGFLTSDVINKYNQIEGFFNENDCMHFYLILTMQSSLGIRGDILEIGSYFGRSASLLVYCLAPDEKLVVCDVFKMQSEDFYHNKPSIDDLKNNIRLVNPDYNEKYLEIHSCYSTDLDLKGTDFFQFIHIDGGHS